MKNYLVALSLLATANSFADTVQPIVVGRHIQPVRVNTVTAKPVGEHGFPSTQLSVTATFGNECEVPKSEELVSITRYENNYRNLVITLGNDSDRICPAVYRPVTVTIGLGQFTKPNDGLFSKILVNGIAAKKQN